MNVLLSTPALQGQTVQAGNSFMNSDQQQSLLHQLRADPIALMRQSMEQREYLEKCVKANESLLHILVFNAPSGWKEWRSDEEVWRATRDTMLLNVWRCWFVLEQVRQELDLFHD